MIHTLSGRSTLGAAGLFLLSAVQAGTPLWTFTALTPTSFSISSADTATVQYIVKNQSHKSKVLVLDSILTPGIQKNAPCILPPDSPGGTVPFNAYC